MRLIVPAEDAKSAVDLAKFKDPTKLLQHVAEALGLRYTLDEEAGKVYLGSPRPAGTTKPGKPPAPAPKKGDRITFPSGYTIARAAEKDWTPGSGFWTPHPEEASWLFEVPANPDKIQVSEHFTLGEFLPRAGVVGTPNYTHARVSPRVVELAEEVRELLGGIPVHVNSCYRPPVYNRAIGGASSSYHMDGLAVDLSAAVPFVQLEDACRRSQQKSGGGLGIYPPGAGEFCHRDVGPWATW